MRTAIAIFRSVYAVSVFGNDQSHLTICPDGSSSQPCGKDGCRPGYECLRGQCCRQPTDNCPSGVIGPVCSDYNPCKPGYDCRGGRCCRQHTGNCPSGVIGPACSDYNPCKPGYDCRGGRCCRQQSSCSSGIDGPTCSEDTPCEPGYACKKGRCCAVCPKGRKEGGPCNRTPGEARCPPSHSCINDLCCDVERRSYSLIDPNIEFICPPWTFEPECLTDKDCRKGKLCCSGPCRTLRCTIGV